MRYKLTENELNERFVLISINPQYVDLIKKGIKRIEYRKRIPTTTDKYKLVIYETAPIKKITCIADAVYHEKGMAQDVWEKTKDFGGIDDKWFFSYFGGLKGFSCGIGITNPIILEKPLDLKEIGLNSVPQSWQYITKEQFDKIVNNNGNF